MSDKKQPLVGPVVPVYENNNNNIHISRDEDTIEDEGQVVAPASDTPDLLPFPILKQIALEARKKSLTINLEESEGRIKLDNLYTTATNSRGPAAVGIKGSNKLRDSAQLTTTAAATCKTENKNKKCKSKFNKVKATNDDTSSSSSGSEFGNYNYNKHHQVIECEKQPPKRTDTQVSESDRNNNNNKTKTFKRQDDDEVNYGDYEDEDLFEDDNEDDDDMWYDEPQYRVIYKRRATPYHHNISNAIEPRDRTLSTITESSSDEMAKVSKCTLGDEREKQVEINFEKVKASSLRRKEREKEKRENEREEREEKDEREKEKGGGEEDSPFKRTRSVRFSKKKSLRRYDPSNNSIASIEPSESTGGSITPIVTKMSTCHGHGSPGRIGKNKAFRHTVSCSTGVTRPRTIFQDEGINTRSRSLRYTPPNPHLLYPSQVNSHFALMNGTSVDGTSATHQIYARRKSLLNTLFGHAGHRRFSEDLKPIWQDAEENEKKETSLTQVTCHGEKGSTPVGEKDGPGGGGDDGNDDSFMDPTGFKAKSYAVILASQETTRVIFFQVFIPFLIAGFDNVGAGIILDHVQHWDVFKIIPELFILVASFLGLKGNLEMTLAARLATMANIGELDKPSCRWKIALGNLALVQGQAIVVALLASLIAIFVNYFKEPDYDFDDSFLICVTGLVTASITGLAMATLMVTATVVARKVGINPDNVSALIASIMGDISAVTLLAVSAKVFHDTRSHINYYAPVIILFYLAVLVVSLVVARKNIYTHDVVGTGWLPIIVAMIISSAAGFVFDVAVGFFETIAVVQPIVNGVGGNLIAVQASRISTYFHLRCPMGSLPLEEDDSVYSSTCTSPLKAFVGQREYIFILPLPLHLAALEG